MWCVSFEVEERGFSVKNVTIDNSNNNEKYGSNGIGIGEALKFQGIGNLLNVYGNNTFNK